MKKSRERGPKSKYPKVVTSASAANKRLNSSLKVQTNPSPANRKMNSFPKVKK